MKERLSNCWALLMVLLIALFTFSCDDEEKYTTSKRAKLTFSCDTVRFDTVFTTIGSSTQLFKVYNRGKESLLIPSIRLGSGGESGFRINLDGKSGNAFSDVELRNGDSLYVFAEVTVDPNDEDNPFLLRDSLVFNLASGIVQQVQFEAYGQDMIPLRGIVFNSDTTLSASRPYVIYDSLQVDSQTTLCLEAGTRLHFHQGAFMRVCGTLVAEGTLAQPIVFRGDRLDNLFDYLPYDRLDRQWEGITFTGSSFDNHLQYVDIHGGNYGILCDSSTCEKPKLLLENSVIHNVGGNALQATNCSIVVGNSQLTNAYSHCVYIRGGRAEFIFTTIANFYPWDYRAAALRLSNEEVPLHAADFRNCIITGYSSNEIMKSRHIPENKDEATLTFNYSFSNSLIGIPSDSINGEVYQVVRPDSVGNPVSRIDNFPLIDTDIFFYDFTLDSLSVAIGLGNESDALMRYPLDRLGRERLTDGTADAGAYEYQR